jgi:lipoprotein-anchoring transpeptidase ErfK/SrfK
MTRVSGWPAPTVKKHQISATTSNRFWQIAALTVAGTLGVATRADAAVLWSDPDAGYSRPVIVAPPRPHRARRHKEKQAQETLKETKPQGPLIINVSISKQSVKIYDANGFFAEAPVSTGMAGHATPMGAFSVIQKQKMHHSNIYSGAPMPFMQRITWSGVAMHAGVLPGYPASHGCIRMPTAFAVKMYGWTKMGARVIVTPGALTPRPFSHPLLVTQKVVPQPVAVDVPKPDASAKGDKVASTDVKPATLEPKLELRSTVGHDSQFSTVMNEPAAPTPLREQTHTADAAASPAGKMPVTMSDAMAAVPQAPGNTAAGNSEPKSDAVKSEAEPIATEITDRAAEAASSDDKPVKAKAAEARSEVKPAEIAAADQADQTKADDAPKAAAAPSTDAVNNDVAAAKTVMPTVDIAKAAERITDKPDDKAGAKPGDDVTAVTAAPAGAVDAKKDQGRPADPQKAAVPPKPALAMATGSGPISVFISRKDGKLYVRQNFAPLFNVPVTIAASDRPLGTHIFTAEADKNDANILRWSVVTLPAARKAERREDDERAAHHRKMAGAVEIAKSVPEPDSPAEALDRITIPADAMARITDALSTGGSIIVSDQGIAAGETGEGTDFIVSLR